MDGLKTYSMLSRIKQLWHKAQAKKGIHKSGKRVKYAFSVGVRDYYQLVNDLDLPEKRFAYLRHYYHEMQMRMSKEVLLQFVEAMKKAVNPEKGKAVELGKVDRLLDEIKDRTEWLFEPDSLYRLASVVYFTMDEDITDYDEKLNEAKVKAFKKKGMLSHFLQTLTDEQSGLFNLSPDALKTYSEQVMELSRKQLDFAGQSK